MTISRICNFTERLLCFPPVTVWPDEAKPRRAPGESVSVMTMPDGSAAEPAAVYPAISAWPGVTTHNKDGRPCLADAEGAVAVAESNPQAYWDIVIPKCQNLLAQGWVEFKGDSDKVDRAEKKILEITESLKDGVDLRTKSEAVAIKFVDLENDKGVLKGWLANESRPKVKVAIQNRIKNT